MSGWVRPGASTIDLWMFPASFRFLGPFLTLRLTWGPSRDGASIAAEWKPSLGTWAFNAIGWIGTGWIIAIATVLASSMYGIPDQTLGLSDVVFVVVVYIVWVVLAVRAHIARLRESDERDDVVAFIEEYFSATLNPSAGRATPHATRSDRSTS